MVSQVSAPSTFLALSFIFVVAISVADAGSFCSNYVVATHEAQALHQETEGKGAMGPAITETMYAIGGVLGPLLGGLLYHSVAWSGLLLVLGLTGLLLSILALPTFTLAPSPIQQAEQQDAPVTYWSALRMPTTQATCLTMVASGITASWYLPSLESHLTLTLGVSPTTVSLVYMCSTLVYALLTPLTALLMERGVPHLLLLLLGTLANIVAYLILGPSPLLPLAPSVLTTVAALLLQGLGISITAITCLNYLMVGVGAEEEGSQGVVTSMWLCCELTGQYLGSTLGGLAAHAWGFGPATSVVLALEATVLLLLALLATAECCSSPPPTPPVTANTNVAIEGDS